MPHQDLQHAVGYGQGVAYVGDFTDLVGVSQVGRHDDVGPFVESDFHRQVGHQAAIHIGFAFDFNRSKNARGGHAGPHHEPQTAVVKRHQFAIAVARGDSAKGNLELVEIAARWHIGSQLLHQRQKTLAIADPARKRELAVLDAQFQIYRIALLVFPRAVRKLGAVQLVQRDAARIQFANHRFNALCAHAAGIQTANDRTHAGADDFGNLNVVPLQSPQQGQMCKAFGTSTGQHHSHARCVFELRNLCDSAGWRAAE